MLTQHIALVPEAEDVNLSELTKVSAALQKQVARDLAPAWGVSATVDAFAALDDVPIGYCPVIITRGELGEQAGVHLDDNGQPYAQVQLSQHWSLSASRAVLELLVNPFGTRNVAAQSLRSDQGPVEYVVEVCGPCDDARYAYSINGVAVADFCLPAFYEPFSAAALGARLTFSGAAKTPLQPLPGGHVSWYDAVAGHCWLRSHWGDNPIDTRLGSARGAAVRELLNTCKPRRAASTRPLSGTLAADAEHAQLASQVRAQRLRALLGRRLDAPELGSDGARGGGELLERMSPGRVNTLDGGFTLGGDRPRKLAALKAADPRVVELEPHMVELEPLEYELVESAELEEITLPATPGAAALAAIEIELEPLPPPARVPAIEPAEIVAETATTSAPPPLEGLRPTAERIRVPSLAPVSLPSVADERDKPRGKTPWIATGVALAAAAGLMIWTSARGAHHTPKHAAHAPAAHGGPNGQTTSKPAAARAPAPAAEANELLPQLALDPDHPAPSAATAPAVPADQKSPPPPTAEAPAPARAPAHALAHAPTHALALAPAPAPAPAAAPTHALAHALAPSDAPAHSLADREPASHLPNPEPAQMPVLKISSPDVSDLIGSRK